MGLFKKIKDRFKKSLTQNVGGVAGTFTNLVQGNFKEAAAEATRAVIGASGPDLTGVNNYLLSKTVSGAGLKVTDSGKLVKKGGDKGPASFVEPESVPGETPAQAELRRLRKLQAEALLSGRTSTISTSPLGLTEAASTQPRTLLGG